MLWAADHPQRREYWVGTSTALTLAANAIAPGLLDRYLGRTGFDSQQTGQPHDPHAPVNLFSPADGASQIFGCVFSGTALRNAIVWPSGDQRGEVSPVR